MWEFTVCELVHSGSQPFDYGITGPDDDGACGQIVLYCDTTLLTVHV